MKRTPGWYGNYYWSGEQWSTLTRSVAGNSVVGHGKTRDEARRNFARLSKDAYNNPKQVDRTAETISIGDELVNPLREPFKRNGMAPIRRVIAANETDFLFDNGQSAPIYNERGERYIYRNIKSVPAKYFKPVLSTETA